MRFAFLLLLSCIPLQVFASVQVLNQTTSSVTIEFRMEEFTESPDTIDNKPYVFYSFKDGIVEELAGKPAIPIVSTMLAVPYQSKVQHQTSVLESESRNGVDVLPLNQLNVRGKWEEMPPDSTVYESAVPFPEDLVKIGKPFNYLGVNVVSLKINPVQYFPRNHRVEIRKKVRIRFLFKNTTQQVPTARTLSKREMEQLSYKIANYQQAAAFAYPVSKSFRKQAVNYDFSSGQWFRIPITSEGVYQLTGAFLKENGVDINSVQLANVHIYNYGGFALPYATSASRPQDLNENAIMVVDNDQDGIMDENDRIIFYGKGLGGFKFNEKVGFFDWEYYGHPEDGANSLINRTLFPYDDTNYYLFTVNNVPGKRIQAVQSPQMSNPVKPSTFEDMFHFEEDKYNILSSGTDWYWVRFSGLKETKTVSFNLPQHIASAASTLHFGFKGASGSFYGDSEPYRYYFTGFLNDVNVFTDYTRYQNQSGVVKVNENDLSGLHAGANEFNIQYRGTLDGCEAYLDYFELFLQRPFIAENNFLHFRYFLSNTSPHEFTVTGMPAGDNLVWDLTDLANLKRIIPIQNGQTVVFQDVTENRKAGEYLVFSLSTVKTVESIQTIENHPNLRDPSRKAEFIIITADEFYDAAEFLEDLRESQIPDPLVTERVKVENIYDEFSSSVKDVTAIRDFLKYAYENWSDSLKYVLLFGDGHYDYRNIQLKDYKNYVPPFEITNESEVDSRETDNYYVDFDMGGSVSSIMPWIPIGRIAVNNLDQIEVYKEKLLNYTHSYLINPDLNGWQTSVTLVSDDEKGSGSSNNELSWHLEPTETVNKKYLPRKFTRTKIYLHDYDPIAGGLGRWKAKATEDLINQINQGTLFITYFGHGSPDTWAHESVLNRTRDLPKIHNEFRLPLWVAATCTWGKYDDANRSAMSEELIWLPQRGGISVLAAARPVFVHSNVELAQNFFKYLFRNKSEVLPSRRLGDALNYAMNSAPNYQKYHLFGDPTMHLADPRYVVKIESIQPDTLKALSTVNVTGSVTDHEGNLLPNFNGYAVLQAFDAVDSNWVWISYTKQLEYNYRGGTIFRGLVSVEQGHFSGRFIVPKSIKYKHDRTGRLGIYAWSDDEDAIGFNDSLMFYGTKGEVNDPEGPDIEVTFKDVPNFFDGDYVSSQPTLVVNLQDSSGINLTGEVGHRIEITVDENLKKDITQFFVYDPNSYQKGKLEYTLPAMSSGNHQIKISCWDNLNNFSEANVAFRTSEPGELVLTQVVNYPNPFANDTYFTFQLNTDLSTADVTISIYTVTGRKIQEIHRIAEQGFNKIYWDGMDWDGDILANGVYLYKIVVDDGQKRIEKIDKLAVVR